MDEGDEDEDIYKAQRVVRVGSSNCASRWLMSDRLVESACSVGHVYFVENSKKVLIFVHRDPMSSILVYPFQVTSTYCARIDI